MGLLKRKAWVVWTAFILLLPAVVLAAGGEGEVHHVSLFMEISRLVNFLIFVFILYKLAGEPIKNYFRNRAHSIEVAIKEAQEAREEAYKRAKEYEERLLKADMELKEVLVQAERERDEQIKRVREETKRILERIREQSEAAADLEVKKAKVELRRESADLAIKIAEGLLRESFTDEDQRRFLREYAAKVKEVH